jgi:RNA polymerase II subunit A C-terminal domain phosphatase
LFLLCFFNKTIFFFQTTGEVPSDLDSNSMGSEDPIDEVDDGDWNMMGAALEREFLGLED